MILLGSTLQKTPVVGIQTGSVIAHAHRAIVDPGKLTVFAYEVTGPLVPQHPSYLLTRDIRELSNLGAIIDSVDELVADGDVIALNELVTLNFNPVGMRVQDEKGNKLGKVSDYTLDVGSYYVQQLVVKRPLINSLNDTELLVHRTQIIEINNSAIVVHSAAKAPEPQRNEVLGSYINPFRKQNEVSEQIMTREHS